MGCGWLERTLGIISVIVLILDNYGHQQIQEGIAPVWLSEGTFPTSGWPVEDHLANSHVGRNRISRSMNIFIDSCRNLISTIFNFLSG